MKQVECNNLLCLLLGALAIASINIFYLVHPKKVYCTVYIFVDDIRFTFHVPWIHVFYVRITEELEYSENEKKYNHFCLSESWSLANRLMTMMADIPSKNSKRWRKKGKEKKKQKNKILFYVEKHSHRNFFYFKIVEFKA